MRYCCVQLSRPTSVSESQICYPCRCISLLGTRDRVHREHDQGHAQDQRIMRGQCNTMIDKFINFWRQIGVIRRAHHLLMDAWSVPRGAPCFIISHGVVLDCFIIKWAGAPMMSASRPVPLGTDGGGRGEPLSIFSSLSTLLSLCYSCLYYFMFV